jgi:hypothetical protein
MGLACLREQRLTVRRLLVADPDGYLIRLSQRVELVDLD